LGIIDLTPVLCCIQDIGSWLDHIPGLRAIVAVILIFFLPGFAWSFIFFTREQVNRLERFVLSIGLSIAMVTVSMYALNLVLDVKVSGTNAVIDILAMTFIAVVFYQVKKRVKLPNWRRSK